MFSIILYMLRLLAIALPPFSFHLFSPLTVTFPNLSVILRPLYSFYVCLKLSAVPYISAAIQQGFPVSTLLFAVVITLALKMESLYSSETLVPTYKSTRRYYAEDRHGHLHRPESFLSQLFHDLFRRLAVCHLLSSQCFSYV
jgi:hypothetical protein